MGKPPTKNNIQAVTMIRKLIRATILSGVLSYFYVVDFINSLHLAPSISSTFFHLVSIFFTEECRYYIFVVKFHIFPPLFHILRFSAISAPKFRIPEHRIY